MHLGTGYRVVSTAPGSLTAPTLPKKCSDSGARLYLRSPRFALPGGSTVHADSASCNQHALHGAGAANGQGARQEKEAKGRPADEAALQSADRTQLSPHAFARHKFSASCPQTRRTGTWVCWHDSAPLQAGLPVWEGHRCWVQSLLVTP